MPNADYAYLTTMTVSNDDKQKLKRMSDATGKPMYKILNEIMSGIEEVKGGKKRMVKKLGTVNILEEDFNFIDDLAVEKDLYKYQIVNELVKAYKQVHGIEEEQ